jgi:hypothetical protein
MDPNPNIELMLECFKANNTYENRKKVFNEIFNYKPNILLFEENGKYCSYDSYNNVLVVKKNKSLYNNGCSEQDWFKKYFPVNYEIWIKFNRLKKLSHVASSD